MPRLYFTLLMLVAIAAIVPVAAAPIPKVPPDTTKDRDGNPLPKGATARLGSRLFFGQGLGGLAFSADGKRLLTLPETERVFVWDAETGKTLPAMPITWGDAGDGEQSIAGAIAGNRVIWITQPVNKAPPGGIDPKAVSTAYAFDLVDGGIISRIQFTGRVNFDVLPHRSWNAAASADGKYLAVAPEHAKAVEVFDMQSGKRLHSHDLAGGGDPTVYISPEAKTLYVTEYKKPLRRFELAGGKELPAVADTEGDIDLLAASLDGKRLAVRGWTRMEEKGKESGESFLTVVDTVANKSLGKLELGASPLDFGFTDSGSIIVLTAKYRKGLPPTYILSRWDATTLKREWEVPGPDLPNKLSLRVIVAPGWCKRFVLSDQQNFVYVYDTATGKMVVEPSGHQARTASVGFSPDGERITTVGRDAMRTWTTTGERKSVVTLPELTRGWIDPTQLGEHLAWMALKEDGKSAELVGWDRAKDEIGWRMAIDLVEPIKVLSNDGKRVALVSRNKQPQVLDVTIFDGPKGKKLHSWSFKPDQIKSGGLGPMTLSPNGETLYIGGQGIAAFDVKSGKVNSRLEVGEVERVEHYSNTPLVVSPDGSRIAVVTRNARGRGQTLRVCDVKGKALVEHELGEVYKPALRFSPSGKQIAVWHLWDTTVRVCDAESSLSPLRKLEGDKSRALCAAFSPNGASLAVGYEDGTSLIWDLTAKRPPLP